MNVLIKALEEHERHRQECLRSVRHEIFMRGIADKWDAIAAAEEWHELAEPKPCFGLAEDEIKPMHKTWRIAQ